MVQLGKRTYRPENKTNRVNWVLVVKLTPYASIELKTYIFPKKILHFECVLWYTVYHEML